MISVDVPRSGDRLELDFVAPAPRSFERTLDDVADVDALVHGFGCVFTGQVDEVADQSRQFLDLRDDVGTKFCHVLVGNLRRTGAT